MMMYQSLSMAARPFSTTNMKTFQRGSRKLAHSRTRRKVPGEENVPTGLMGGTSGECFVSSELLRRGVLALHTTGGNPGFDLVALIPGDGNLVRIEVKTVQDRNNVFDAPRPYPPDPHRFDFCVFVRPSGDPAVGNPPRAPYEAVIAEPAVVERMYRGGPRPDCNPDRLGADLPNYLNNWDLIRQALG